MSPLAALILIVIAIVISVIFGTKKANMGARDIIGSTKKNHDN